MRRPNRDRTRNWLTVLGGLACLAVIAASPAQAAPRAGGELHRIGFSALAKSPGGTFESPSFSFRWAVSASPGLVTGRPTDAQTLLRGDRSQRCQAIHVDFIAGGQAQSAAVSVWRGNRVPVRADITSDQRKTLDVALRPGQSWALAASTPASSLSVYADGWALCRSGRGIGAGADRSTIQQHVLENGTYAAK